MDSNDASLLVSDDEEEDDDDGLPNEYDYHDSFIDDEDMHDSMRVDRGGQLDDQRVLSEHYR